MKIDILKTKTEWNSFLEKVENYDFYHTYDYHHLSKLPNEYPVLIKCEEGDTIIGLPLLIREIKGSSYRDAISVYGYSGPISTNLLSNFDLSLYRHTMTQYFIQEKIVSVFLRLNPYLANQSIIFHDFGRLAYLGKVVNINLTLSLEKQRQKYNRRLKNHVNKANRECFVKKASSEGDLKAFKDLYFESMDRVNAKGFYYFSDEYFEKIINSKDFKTEVLLAIHNETSIPIAGCMFIKRNKTVQYHLSGSKTEYMHINATKLLIDRMRIEATAEGYKTFNLGGGLGGSVTDSLFRFKSSFSDEYRHFFIWKLIVDQNKYNELCDKNNVSNLSTNFFPLYRYQE